MPTEDLAADESNPNGLAHISNNEYGEVLTLFKHAPDGSSRRALFRRKRVVRAEGSKEVPRLAAIMEDAGYAALHVRGLMAYLKKKRGLEKLRKPDLGVETRWLFHQDLLEWLLESMSADSFERLDDIIEYLLHLWTSPNGA